MPNAALVASQGLDAGEHLRLLTEKVEELTLYVIALNDELCHLKQNKK